MPRVVAFRVTAYTTFVTPWIANLPAHEPGDLLLVFINKDDSAGGNLVNSTEGWSAVTQAARMSSGNLRAGYSWKFAATSDEAAPSLSNGDADEAHLVAMTIRGAAQPPGGPVDADASVLSEGFPTQICPSVVTSVPGCLVLWACCNDGAHQPTALVDGGGVSNLTNEDANACACGVAYGYQAVAGSTRATQFYTTNSGAAADRAILFTVALRDDGTGHVAVYPDATSRLSCVEPFLGVSRPLGGSFQTTIPVATIDGVTVLYDAHGGASDSGVNFLSGSTSHTPPSRADSMSGFAVSLNVARPVDVRAGALVGTYLFSRPREAFDAGTLAQRGVMMSYGQGTSFATHVIAASDATDMANDARNYYMLQPGQAVSTRLAVTDPAPDLSAIATLMITSQARGGALVMFFSELLHVTELVAAGGSAAFPMTFADLRDRVARCHPMPLMLSRGVSDGVLLCPLRLGGGNDAMHAALDACSIQFPARYRGTPPVRVLGHFDEGYMGLVLDARAGDTLRITNSLMASATRYRFEIAATASASASWGLAGLTIVNADVVLRPVAAFSGVTFVDCPSFAHNGTALTDCAFSGTTVVTADPSTISASGFSRGNAAAGATNALRLTATGSFALSGLDFEGYAADGQAGAAVLNDSGGAVTLTIGGGVDPPSVVNGPGASTTVVSGAQLTLTGLQPDSEVRAYAGTDPGTATELAGVENSGTSFSFTHTAGGQAGYLVVAALGFQNILLPLTYSSQDQTIPVQQAVDRQYANPA
jgi:hypothetical protein